MFSLPIRNKGKAPESAQAASGSPSNPQANASAGSDAIDDETAHGSPSNPQANASAESDAIDDKSTSQPPAKEEALNVLLWEGQGTNRTNVKCSYKLAGNPHFKLTLNDGILTSTKVPGVLNLSRKEEKKQAGREGASDWDKIGRGEVEAGTAITVEFYYERVESGLQWKRRWYITERSS